MSNIHSNSHIGTNNRPNQSDNKTSGSSQPTENKSKKELEKEGNDFKKLMEKLKKEKDNENLEELISDLTSQPINPMLVKTALGIEQTNANDDRISAITTDMATEATGRTAANLKTDILAASEQAKSKATEAGLKTNMAELETMLNKISAPETLKGDQMSFMLKNTPFSGTKITLQVVDGNLNATMTTPNVINPVAVSEASEHMKNRLADSFPELNINVRVERQQDQGQEQGREQNQQDTDPDDELL